MTLEYLREILADMIKATSDDLRRAREDGDDLQADYLEIERDVLFRVLAVVDAGPDEP